MRGPPGGPGAVGSWPWRPGPGLWWACRAERGSRRLAVSLPLTGSLRPEAGGRARTRDRGGSALCGAGDAGTGRPGSGGGSPGSCGRARAGDTGTRPAAESVSGARASLESRLPSSAELAGRGPVGSPEGADAEHRPLAQCGGGPAGGDGGSGLSWRVGQGCPRGEDAGRTEARASRVPRPPWSLRPLGRGPPVPGCGLFPGKAGTCFQHTLPVRVRSHLLCIPCVDRCSDSLGHVQNEVE